MAADPDKGMIDWNPDREGWYVVNDGVMGGISRSRATLSDHGTLLFSGTVSLENNGGFASIRHDAQLFTLADGSGIRLLVKGDGKTYQLRVRTSDRFDGIAYKVNFTTDQGVWQEFRFPWEEFAATFRGREVEGAPELKGAHVQQVGFLIADKQSGAFELEIAFIGSLDDGG